MHYYISLKHYKFNLQSHFILMLIGFSIIIDSILVSSI